MFCCCQCDYSHHFTEYKCIRKCHDISYFSFTLFISGRVLQEYHQCCHPFYCCRNYYLESMNNCWWHYSLLLIMHTGRWRRNKRTSNRSSYRTSVFLQNCRTTVHLIRQPVFGDFVCQNREGSDGILRLMKVKGLQKFQRGVEGGAEGVIVFESWGEQLARYVDVLSPLWRPKSVSDTCIGCNGKNKSSR